MLCIIFGKSWVPLELVANAARQDSEIKVKKKKFRKLTLKHTNQIEKWTTCLVKRQRHSRGKGFLNTVYIVEQYGIFPTAMRPKPTEYNHKKKIIGG